MLWKYMKQTKYATIVYVWLDHEECDPNNEVFHLVISNHFSFVYWNSADFWEIINRELFLHKE